MKKMIAVLTPNSILLGVVLVMAPFAQAMEADLAVPVAQEKQQTESIPLFSENDSLTDFVLRWEFPKVCKYVFDPEFKQPTSTDFSALEPGDFIFMRGIQAHEFFKTVAPSIKVPYGILCHGEYRDAFKEEYLPYLDDPRLIAWFGVHPCEASHEKYHPLPLGIYSPRTLKELEDKKMNPADCCKSNEHLNSLFKELRGIAKPTLVYSNFANHMHPDRPKVAELFNDKPYCFTAKERVNQETYLRQMATCKFALSPRGEGIDCYRNWEALLVGCIPILLQCPLKPLFEELPVLLVDRWEDITEEKLNQSYETFASKKYSLEKLYCGYWLAKIAAVKKSYFERYQTLQQGETNSIDHVSID